MTLCLGVGCGFVQYLVIAYMCVASFIVLVMIILSFQMGTRILSNVSFKKLGPFRLEQYYNFRLRLRYCTETDCLLQMEQIIDVYILKSTQKTIKSCMHEKQLLFNRWIDHTLQLVAMSYEIPHTLEQVAMPIVTSAISIWSTIA